MLRMDDEKEFRIRPRRPRLSRNQNESAVWATAFKRILHYARTSRKGARASKAFHTFRSNRSHFQRCFVRVSYTRNVTAGQWHAHGRYRELAAYLSPSITALL